MKTNNTIHTIQTKVGQSGSIQIETVITKGLYRFSILGVNQKQSSDARDRIYSALRATDLLNLKSDNRKITVNFLPSEHVDYDPTYDLAIALSCIRCIRGQTSSEKILALGQLSIAGEVVGSRKLLQSIHVAIEEGIQTIVCGEDDLSCLYPELILLLKKHSINIVSGKRLDQLIDHLDNDFYYTPQEQLSETNARAETETVNNSSTPPAFLTNEVLWLASIALCGGHSIAFESSNAIFVEDFISNIYEQSPDLHTKQLVSMANLTKEPDSVVLEYYKKPKLFHIHTQTTKQDLYSTNQGGLKGNIGLLQKSILGGIIIPQLTNISAHVWNLLTTSVTGDIFGICTSCPCGIQSNFFTNKIQKCICIQRSILRHRQHIHATYLDFFSIWVKVTGQIPKLSMDDIRSFHSHVDKVRRYQFERYTHELAPQSTPYEYETSRKHLNSCRAVSLILKELDFEAKDLYVSFSDLYNKVALEKILRLAQTIQDIESISQNKSTAVTKQTVLLALSCIPKKDF